MADNVQVNVQINATIGVTRPQINSGPITITLTGDGINAGIQSIGTSEEDLDYGDIAAADAGLLYLRNLDSTNYVDWGMSDAGTMKAVGRLKPGGAPAVFNVKPGTQVRLQANTAACDVQFQLLKT